MKKREGSIVVFSLMILSLIVFLTLQFLRSVYVGSSFINSMIDRERAEVLALSGINIAMAQLAVDESDIEEETTTKTPQVAQEKKGSKTDEMMAKEFLKRLLPNINRWQVFDLEEKDDGIEGTIKICITCEHGKINLNEAFDFEKQEFKKEFEAMLKGLEIKDKLAAGEILTRIQEFLTKRRKKLEDVSQLQAVEGLEAIDMFYHPPKIAQSKQEKWEPNERLALQDIFTVWTANDQLEPLLLSDSLCAILGLRRPVGNDAEIMEEKFKQLVELFNQNWGKNWDENWKHIEEIYEQKPKFLKDLKRVFSKQFGPLVFSVLSWAKVGQVEQKLLAIVKKEKKDNRDKKKDGLFDKAVPEKQKKQDQEQEKASPSLSLVRVYWL